MSIRIFGACSVPFVMFFQKNDNEKELLRISHAHKSQNELVQKLQAKSDKVPFIGFMFDRI